MQRTARLITASLALMISVSFVLAQTSSAQEDTSDVITDAQIRAIRAQCTEIQATLYRVQQSDKVLRHDRGNLYRTIADKLMIPLNQRIASNQLDGSGLVSISARFNTTYQRFYNAYKVYDDAMTKAQSIDCTKNPTQYYDAIADARAKRTALYMSSTELIQLAGRYDEEFKIFRERQTKGSQE